MKIILLLHYTPTLDTLQRYYEKLNGLESLIKTDFFCEKEYDRLELRNSCVRSCLRNSSLNDLLKVCHASISSLYK